MYTLVICVDKKNQLDVTFCILYFSSNSCSSSNSCIPLPLARGFQPEYKQDAPDTETGNQEN